MPYRERHKRIEKCAKWRRTNHAYQKRVALASRSRVKVAGLWPKYRSMIAHSACANCGYANPEALSFHHVDPATKLYTMCELARRIATPENDRLFHAELAKCICLCENCHAIETKKQLRAGLLVCQKYRDAAGAPPTRDLQLEFDFASASA